MSSTRHVDTTTATEGTEDDPLEEVAENRELFERIADADLPLSDACERALEKLDEEGGDDGGH